LFAKLIVGTSCFYVNSATVYTFFSSILFSLDYGNLKRRLVVLLPSAWDICWKGLLYQFKKEN